MLTTTKQMKTKYEDSNKVSYLAITKLGYCRLYMATLKAAVRVHSQVSSLELHSNECRLTLDKVYPNFI